MTRLFYASPYATKNLEAASLPDQSTELRAASKSALCPATKQLHVLHQLPPDGVNALVVSTASSLF
jgi:hypothetical protein